MNYPINITHELIMETRKLYSRKDVKYAEEDFRKFFGDNIPEELVSYYERYVLAIGKMRCKYDYETNSFIEVGLSLKRSE